MAIEVVKFRAYSKNTLQGFLTVRLSNVGLEIRDIALHMKNGKRWLQLPSKPYQKDDGAQAWSYILAFYDKHRHKQFQEMTLKALDAFER